MYITTKTQEIIDAYSTAAGTGIFVPEIEIGVEDFCGFVDDKNREREREDEVMKEILINCFILI